MNGGGVVLRAEGVTKRYPGTTALDRVDYSLRRAKVNVLVGENGAGKSTLMKILAGVERPTEGKLLLDGSEVRFESPADAAAASIGMVYQELNLCPNLTVAENIFLARERTRGGWVDRRWQERLAVKLLAALDQPIPPDALVGGLRLGEQQIVEIAKALARDVRILILDEPTSALSAAEVESLFRVIGDLRERGVTIVYISHRLEELLRIGDYVSVLRDGRLVAEAPAAEIDLNWIVEKMVGGRLEKIFHRDAGEAGAELLRVEGVRLAGPSGVKLLDGVSLNVRAGEIVGIYGLMGAGRTELLECVAGVRRATGGSIQLEGREMRGETVEQRIARGVVLVPEDRQAAGLVQTLSVLDNVLLASLGRWRRGPLLDYGRARESVRAQARDLSIRAASLEQPVTSLSGGNQQKVVVAKCLLTGPRVLLLDEPARGVDVGAKGEICGIMNRLAARGMGILFASSELEEALGMADRIVVLAKGRVTAEFARRDATHAALAAAASAGGGHG